MVPLRHTNLALNTMTPETLAVLKQGGLVLTVNRRLARHVQQQFGAAQLAAGREVWPTPKVAAWQDWLGTLWQRCSHRHSLLLLESHQRRAVWEGVVSASAVAGQLLNRSSTAVMVAKAYDLLKQWSLELDAVADVEHPDVQAFAAWGCDYEACCRRHGWLDGHAQLALLIRYIEEGCFTLPAQIIWLGFDSLTPQQLQLMAVQRQYGCRVSSETVATAPGGRIERRPCSDAAAELQRAALWTKQLLAQEGESRIAVVVPDLAALRNDVTRIFDEVLCPEVVLKLSDEIDRPYNLSCGVPLAELPLIAAALQLLSLATSPLELPPLGRLIQSPYLAGAERELGVRALLDRQLREQGDARYSLKSVAALAAAERARCPLLAESLSAMLAVVQGMPCRQLPSAWGSDFRRLLDAGGWPGERPLSSPEYQAIEAWRALFSKFSSLDRVVGEIDLSAAVGHLRQLAADHPFQLKTPETRVQILGLLEAAGLDFDHLWITGLHDEAWPAPPRPNPFLPLRLQRQQQMPHACAERELHFARELTQRLLASAGEVVVSYPQRDGDRDLRPSPLISQLPLGDTEPLRPPGLREQIFHARALEPLLDWRAAPLPEGVNVSGGSAIFTDQAACPFRAFGYRRLGARPLPEVVSGLSAAQRGTILHRVLEQFWRDLSGRAQLLALADGELQQRVAAAVETVLAAEARRQPHRFTARFSALERDRLTQLLHAWLEVERRRHPFTLVSCEERRSVSIGGLVVDLKADRIDRLDDDGREMIIDYKSSDSRARAWFGERPDEPQLPLYAVTHPRPVAALAFARLRPDGCGLEGVSDGVAVAKGVIDIEGKREADRGEWREQLAQWRKVVEALASDFRDGRAEVDPKDLHTSCSYCGLEGLCRIGELCRE